jgi:hypothetical protein
MSQGGLASTNLEYGASGCLLACSPVERRRGVPAPPPKFGQGGRLGLGPFGSQKMVEIKPERAFSRNQMGTMDLESNG